MFTALLAVASFAIGAIGYDYVKATNEAPDVVVNAGNTAITQEDSESAKRRRILFHMAGAAAITYLFFKMKK